MQNLWKKYPELVHTVQKDHKKNKKNTSGHDFYHALMTAQYARMIAGDEHTGELAWVAGMCHNTDRIFPEKNKEELEKKVRRYLDKTTGLSEKNKETIQEAVLCHDKLNSDDDSEVAIALKDADRLAGSGALMALRVAQFWRELPIFEPQYVKKRNPNSEFKSPKSLLDNIRDILEWEEMLRLPKAKKIGAKKFAFLRKFLQEVEAQVEEADIQKAKPNITK